MLICRRGGSPVALALGAPSRLISVIGILVLVSLLLLFGQLLPILLDIFALVLPLVSYNLGNLGIGELGILYSNLGLMVLTIQDEGYWGKGGNKAVSWLYKHRPDSIDGGEKDGKGFSIWEARILRGRYSCPKKAPCGNASCSAI